MNRNNKLFLLLIAFLNIYSFVSGQTQGYAVLSDAWSAQYYMLDLCHKDHAQIGNSYQFTYNNLMITFNSYVDTNCESLSFSTDYNFDTLYNGTTYVGVNFDYNNPPIPSNSSYYVKTYETNNCEGGIIYQAGYIAQGQCVPQFFLVNNTGYQMVKCLESGYEYYEQFGATSCSYITYQTTTAPSQECFNNGTLKLVYSCGNFY